jgi:hypothetical protein
MTSATSANGAQRKSLAEQIDRLDVILDGLADALNESVADAVKDVVGRVVREAVEATIREVLGSPELLRAALDRNAEPAPQPQPTPAPEPRQRTLKELLKAARACVTEKASQAARAAYRASVWALGRLKLTCVQAAQGVKRITCRCTSVLSGLAVLGGQAWRFRKSCAFALGVGVLSGAAAYLAGPVLASVASGLAGAALTLAGMILMPLWCLLAGNGNA